MPKIELHLHLVGGTSVATVLALARRHSDAAFPASEEDLRKYYRFRDFAHFLEVYGAVNALVRDDVDILELVTGLGRDLKLAGVRYAEVTVTPVSHLAVGIDPSALAEALTEGRRQVASHDGVELNWVFDVPGSLGVKAAWDTLAWIQRHRPEGTVGFGLGGPELGAGRAMFTGPFTVAREAGLISLPHAGETTGPATIWSAIHDLGATRIGHGISAVTDPRLLAHLAQQRITLEICLTSNVATGAVTELASHPLPRLLQHGVPIALSTDDPGMFGTNLTREYEIATETFGLRDLELAALARTAIESSYCSEALRRELLAGVDSALFGAKIGSSASRAASKS